MGSLPNDSDRYAATVDVRRELARRADSAAYLRGATRYSRALRAAPSPQRAAAGAHACDAGQRRRPLVFRQRLADLRGLVACRAAGRKRIAGGRTAGAGGRTILFAG